MVEENNQKAIRDYFMPVVSENYSEIACQIVLANNFKLKLALINMMQQNQFGGSPINNLNTHFPMF